MLRACSPIKQPPSASRCSKAEPGSACTKLGTSWLRRLIATVLSCNGFSGSSCAIMAHLASKFWAKCVTICSKKLTSPRAETPCAIMRMARSTRLRAVTSRTMACRQKSGPIFIRSMLTSASKVRPSPRLCHQLKNCGAPAIAAIIFSFAAMSDGRPSS